MTVDKTFTRGNVWSIIASVVTTAIGACSVIVYVTLGFSEIDSQAAQNAADIARQDGQMTGYENRLRALEELTTRTDERYVSLFRSAEEMKATLRSVLDELRAMRTDRQ